MSDKPFILGVNDSLAIVGGTFDPVHLGHVEPVNHACSELDITHGLWVPCKLPPHKDRPSTTEQARVDMLNFAIENLDNHQVYQWELQQNNTSYSFHTLTHLRDLYPTQQLFFFMGADSLLNFTQWYQWENILKLCHLVVSARPGFDVSNIPPTLQKRIQSMDIPVTAEHGTIIWFDAVSRSISSSQIREEVRTNAKIREHLNQSVYNYMITNELYRNAKQR